MMKKKITLAVLMGIALSLVSHIADAQVAPKAAPIPRLFKVELTGYPEMTIINFKLEAVPKYRMEPNTERGTIKIIIDGFGYSPALDYKSFEDVRVKKILFKKEASAAVAEIYLKDMRNSIFHSLSPDGKTIVLHLKQRKEMMSLRMDASSPEERQAKARRDAEQAKKSKQLEATSGRDAFKKAVASYQKNDFKAARDDLEEFMKKHPNSVYMEKAMFLYAEALYMLIARERKYSYQAMEAYRAAMNRYPNSADIPRASIRLGDLYYNTDMDIEAMAIYQRVFEKFPQNKYSQRALMGRARIYLDRKLYYEASNELEKVLLLYPGAPEVREAKFQIAEALYLRGQYEMSLKTFESADKRWPSYVKQNPRTLFRFADVYYKLGRSAKAKAMFTDLVNLFPAIGHGRMGVNRIADIYLAEGKTDAAVRLLGLQARIAPDEPEGVESRLRLAALGQAEEKIADIRAEGIVAYPDYVNPLAAYNDIIKKHPDWEQAREAMFQKAKFYHRQKLYIESIITLKGLMRQSKDMAGATVVLDLVKENLNEMVHTFHGQRGHFAVLYTYYDHFDPFFTGLKDPGLLMDVADAYYEMGIFSRSLDKYRQAAALDTEPKFADRSAFGAGRALAALGQHGEAAEGLIPFMAKFAHSPYAAPALETLGEAYSALGKPALAIGAFKAALPIETNPLVASYTAYRAGMLHKEGGEFADAIRMFKDSIDRYKPTYGSVDDYYKMDSHFQMMEAAYRGGMFTDAIAFSKKAVERYSTNKHAVWARYVKGQSETKIDEDETAMASMKALAKDEATTIFGKVAAATADNGDWKIRNKNLFPY